LYASQALLSVKPPPEVFAIAAAQGRQPLAPDGRPYDANDPDRQSGPGRYAPRLAAPGFVTQAAHDAGVLPLDRSLDDRAAAEWVSAEAIDGADLIKLTVWQPRADAAHKLAQALVARALAVNRELETAPETRRVLDEELKKAQAALDEAERSVALSSGNLDV